MSNVTGLFPQQAASALAPGKNKDGFPAWERPLEEKFVQVLLTNTLTNTYYSSKQELLKDSFEIHDAMIKKDPDFAGKAAVFARNKGFMRTQPILALAKLSQVLDRAKLAPIFNQIILTPNDLIDYVTILKSIRGNEGGRKIKTIVGKWLADKVGEYWAIKYGGAKTGQYSLSDLVRLYHPKNPAKNELFKYIVGDPKVTPDLTNLKQISAYESLKKATTASEKVAFIKEGRIPHEEASSFAGSDKEVWGAIVGQMPIFALLRNLQTLNRHGVLQDNKKLVVDTFTSQEAVQKSKILPFQFLKALDFAVFDWAKDAIRDAVDLSFVNVPDIEGTTSVHLDISGSMGGFIQTAAIFAVTAVKKAEDGSLYLFDTVADKFSISKRDSVLTQASKIRVRGGTDTGAPLRKMIAAKEKVDNILIITDEQQNTGSPFFDVLVEYRKKVNPNVKAYILDVSPYHNAMTPDDKNIWYIYGWSDQALSFISMASQGWGSQVQAIKAGKV